MNNPPGSSRSFLQSAWSWVLLPFVAYGACIPFLGKGAIFVPIVVINAPLGIIGCFKKISLDSYDEWKHTFFFAHGVFWFLLFLGLTMRKTMPERRLRAIWVVLVVMLIMSISGCAVQFGPGLRSDGNWH